jgi:hypothetical protein
MGRMRPLAIARSCTEKSEFLGISTSCSNEGLPERVDGCWEVGELSHHCPSRVLDSYVSNAAIRFIFTEISPTGEQNGVIEI